MTTTKVGNRPTCLSPDLRHTSDEMLPLLLTTWLFLCDDHAGLSIALENLSPAGVQFVSELVASGHYASTKDNIEIAGEVLESNRTGEFVSTFSESEQQHVAQMTVASVVIAYHLLVEGAAHDDLRARDMAAEWVDMVCADVVMRRNGSPATVAPPVAPDGGRDT